MFLMLNMLNIYIDNKSSAYEKDKVVEKMYLQSIY